MKHTGIYKIENLIDAKVYIGSAIDISSRWRKHVSELNLSNHSNTHLLHAWNKYGAENFRFIEVELCEPCQLIVREQHYIDFFNACGEGYNICPIAGNTLGTKRSVETKKILSAKACARVHRPHSEETKRKIAQAHMGKKQSDEHNRKAVEGRLRKGPYRHTEERKKKISLATKGVPKPFGMGAKVSAALTGRPQTLEHRQHLSESKKGKPGKPNSPETRRKISESNKGKVLSFESIQKMKETKRRQFELKKTVVST